MGRIIALAIVTGAIWWLWRRWQGPAQTQQKPTNLETQKLSECVRCDAMLPANPSERKEVAQACSHGKRCPLLLEQ